MNAEKAQSGWRGQVLILALIALLGTLPFWLTDLDLWVAAQFYHPDADDPWFEAQAPLWSWLYVASPVLTGVVMLGGLLVLAGGQLWGRLRRLRPYGLLVIATAVIGPGLVVNGVFKDNWGRPRPNQVVELGGTRDYLPPLMLGERGKGKSFPCGHSSVGYMLGVFFLIWRRTRPRLAWLSLAGALALGTLIGVGRMAAGDHFFSDVIWSGVLAYGVALILYDGVLKIPRREAALTGRAPLADRPLAYPRLTALGYGALGLVMLTGVLLATPINDDAQERIRPGEFEPDPRVLRIAADSVDLTLYWMEGQDPALFRLKARGFGLPGSRATHRIEALDGVLNYQIRHRGVFTERDTRLTVGLVPGHWDLVEVRLDSGDIRVHATPAGAPSLTLHSDAGAVVRD